MLHMHLEARPVVFHYRGGEEQGDEEIFYRRGDGIRDEICRGEKAGEYRAGGGIYFFPQRVYR